MGEIYHAAYEKQDGVWTIVSEPACANRSKRRLCRAVTGSAQAALCRAWSGVSERYAGQLQGVDSAVVPQAAAIAALAATFGTGRGMDAAEALPLYLRCKVAQNQRKNTR